MRETLISFLDQFAKSRDAPAIACRRGLRIERWTYGQLADTACQFANLLDSIGVKKGDRVIFWGENSPEWVSAFYGCLVRGAVVVPLDPQSLPAFVLKVQDQVQAGLILCDRLFEGHVAGRIKVLLFDELGVKAREYHSALRARPDIGQDDLVEIIFTSGTTAEPKGVCLTHRNLLANLNPLEEEIQKYIKYERPFHPLRFLCLLPLSHVFGQFMGVFVPQLLGGVAFYQASMNPTEIIEIIGRERISVAAVVPRQLESLREKVERDYTSRGELDRFRWRFDYADGKHFFRRWWIFRDLHFRFGLKFWAFVSGGATLDQETENFWQRLGMAVVQGYGMTETASIISINHPLKLSRGSIGKTLPGHEIRLGAEGEIQVRGENIAAGYWSDGVNPLAGEAGWLSTGDVASMDDEGNLFYKGRKKDVIVTAAGVNIYPEDIESALNHQPEVSASCVIGTDGPQGPEPMAVLILSDPLDDPAEAVSRANSSLNQSQQIRHWAVWPEPDFPRTTTQKIRKVAVKQAIAAAGGHTERSVIASGSVEELISSISRDATHTGNEALKLDSLGRVQLLSAIEDRYQIELDEAVITPTTTLQDVERLIQEGTTGEPIISYPYPAWARRLPVRLLRFLAYYTLVVPFVCAMCWPRTTGRERLKALRGQALFVSNHISMVDPAMILFALPWRFKHQLAIAMIGERLRGLRHALEGGNRFMKIIDVLKYLLVVTVFNVFPMPQKSGFRKSFAFAGQAADDGYSLLVFPEGRTTDDGQIKPFMAGIGLLAGDLGLPVVPLRIEGLFDLKQHRRYFSRPGTVKVTFGDPILFPQGTDQTIIPSQLQNLVESLR